MKRYYELYISHIDWDVDTDETPTLPTSIDEYEVVVKSEDELNDKLVDMLTDEYGFCINHVDFVINTISFKLTKAMKERYIRKTYTDPNFIKIFRDLINYKWRFTYYPIAIPDGYDVELFINNISQDMISREYAEDILRETI